MHWQTTMFTDGLRLSGMTAPMMLDGPMTGGCFAAYARKVPASTLLPAHKSVEGRKAAS
ncbi:MAG: hypothetical protein ABF876_02955 [Acetobacter aceti]|uniref:hypothetical protein n=1 Tax=Acetobacter aceti TaxID=435 RepID=UPI001656CCB9|nr:hypothetical protein [Acetobacter aceti]